MRCVAVEPGNEWFATGSATSIIKIWDLCSGQLKLSLTGHISAVRGLAVGIHRPYLFSCRSNAGISNATRLLGITMDI